VRCRFACVVASHAPLINAMKDGATRLPHGFEYPRKPPKELDFTPPIQAVI
jgi:hypothetical protein